jgi:hypothetical protein
MLNAFRTAALAGWNLSVQKRDVTLLSVCEELSAADRELKGEQAEEPSGAVNGSLHPDLVQAVPEVVAEVVSYARSPMRRNGMYLMIDVGASTLDVSTFILHEDRGEDLCPLLAADVQQLGSIKLHFERIQHVAKAVETHLGEVMKSADPDRPLPEMSDYAPKVPNATAVDARFQSECSSVIARVVKYTRLKRNPNATEWQTGLPVFFCGGGASYDVYQRATTDAAQRLAAIKVAGLSPMALPKPQNLEAPGLLNEQYHRLAVAYGLSFSHLDIGRTVPPAELEDIALDASHRDTTTAFVSKDMV